MSLTIDLYKLFDPIAKKKRIKLVSELNNAIKFTNVAGTISINVQEKDNMALVSIQDSGVGMSPSQQENLFEVQSSLSTEGTAGEKGVGLGLLLVKEFVEKNNGRLWVESEEGVGSTFYFSLDLNDE